jgi:hypothetical protein
VILSEDNDSETNGGLWCDFGMPVYGSWMCMGTPGSKGWDQVGVVDSLTPLSMHDVTAVSHARR